MKSNHVQSRCKEAEPARPVGWTAAVIAERFAVEVGRAQLLAAGAVVLQEVMRRLGATSMRVSRRGIREGAILAYARHGADWLEAASRG